MLAIIGGSGADRFAPLTDVEISAVDTPWGRPSDPVLKGTLNGAGVFFLPRHGKGHRIPPHAINYRANIQALKDCGASAVVAMNAVGAINAQLAPPDLALPDQLIDYTFGREHTYFDGSTGEIRHVDFTEPYDRALRERLAEAAETLGLRCFTPCCYAATQGPRLETAAEIDRLERDGADLVGMTGMPEAALAREVGLPYAALCVVVNMAAGRGEGEITMEEIERNLVDGVANAARVISAVVGQQSAET